MKRSADQLGSSGAGDGPSSKRANDGDNMEESEVSGSAFLLKSQNRALSMELLRNKRVIAEARKELAMMRRKSREMETLVSLIQRAWSQLDIDACVLLDSLGDTEVGVSDEGCSELLHRLIATGSKYLRTDPTSMEHVPQLEVDQWSSKQEVEKERLRLSEEIGDANKPIEKTLQRLTAQQQHQQEQQHEQQQQHHQKQQHQQHQQDASDEETGAAKVALADKSSDREQQQMDVDPHTGASPVVKAENGNADSEQPAGVITKQHQQQQDTTVDVRSIEIDELDQQYGAPIEENLRGHVAFTLSLMERLCSIITEGGDVNIQLEAADALAEIRELRTERLFLLDKITKLSVEIVDLNAKLRLMENEKLQAEKKSDNLQVAMKELEQQSKRLNTSNMSAAAGGTTGEDGAGAGNGGGGDCSTSSSGGGGTGNSNSNGGGSSVLEREMREQIVLLEQQLNDSEAARARVEMTLTERMARPLPQTEAQVKDLREAMEELRKQHKDRVNAMIVEGEKLHEKIRNSELAMMQLEAVSVARIDEVVSATEKKLAVVESDHQETKTKLSLAQAELQLMEQLKAQLAEYKVVEELCNSESAKLRHQVKILQAGQDSLTSDLKKARDRESELEHSLLEKVQKQTNAAGENSSKDAVVGSTSGAIDGSGAAPADKDCNEDGQVTEPTTTSTTTAATTTAATTVEVPKEVTLTEAQLVVKTATARVADLERELEDARGNINDLIMEIEAVSNEAVKAREQGASLLRQIGDSQNLQRGALEENLLLQNQIEDLKTSQTEVENKMGTIKNAMSQQDSLIAQQRAGDVSLRQENATMKKTAAEQQSIRQKESQQQQELQRRVSEKTHEMEAVQKRNQELQQRCNELSKQCEHERKAKMEAQKDSLKPKSKKDKNSSSSTSKSQQGGRGEEADMLDMTLGMLRCSVCKDRFKSAAITRCFHLFCRECIDENLRNRSRKCPACGEKFGQDDVTNIYFN